MTEYAANFGLRTVVDRCGVIAGPWQMGRVDQGVFTFWLLHHHFGRPLTYIGYGGGGHQVRDLLHVDDLVELVDEQLTEPERWDGFVGNVGGGREVSLSLLRDDGDLPRADRQRGADRARRRGAAGRRSALPLRLLAAVRRAQRGDRQRDPREILADIYAWVAEQRGRRRGVAGLRAMKLSVVMPAHNEAGSIAADDPGRDPDARRGRHRARGPRDRRRERGRHRGDRRRDLRRAPAGPVPALALPARVRVRDPLGPRPLPAATRWR